MRRRFSKAAGRDKALRANHPLSAIPGVTWDPDVMGRLPAQGPGLDPGPRSARCSVSPGSRLKAGIAATVHNAPKPNHPAYRFSFTSRCAMYQADPTITAAPVVMKISAGSPNATMPRIVAQTICRKVIGWVTVIGAQA